MDGHLSGRAILSRGPRDDAEPLGLRLERDIELTSEVLHRDAGRQLDNLRFIKLRPEARKKRIADFLPCNRHTLRILERRALRLAEKVAFEST